MEKFGVIAFTHSSIGLEGLSNFHIESESVVERMSALKVYLGLTEVMYLSTCNRVEIAFVRDQDFDNEFTTRLIQFFHPDWTVETSAEMANKSKFWSGINAVNHLIEVACSLDSMVLGEREIITQVRNAFEFARTNKLSGDTIRLIIRHTIETAKKVYTETFISHKSVSVVSLAFKAFLEKNHPKDVAIIIVGSGVTNQKMVRFLVEGGYQNISIYNRTLSSAEELAQRFNLKAYPLSELKNHNQSFDILISCTGANSAVIDQPIYQELLKGDTNQHTLIDMAIPQDISNEVVELNATDYISIETLQVIAKGHLNARRKELLKVRQIIFNALEEFKKRFELRQMEIRLSHIPKKIKAIRSTAINEVFSNEIEQLDSDSKATLDRILDYMEKKYVSVPMLMAKDLVMNEDKK
ncbi:glutamyl-tRNA reductase [Crocinitomix catalasitica]|uniref:glutamyl-tRNA reductase n=1 Tax=Crocinitomix catalasitica TaxID=184607 RepID=UPI0004866E75|nr:glutamyl-tRNA reductase [Crocinitomix catalasitica]